MNDPAEDGDAGNPPGKECQAVGAARWRREHQHDGDDRYWTQRDTDAEGSDLADRLADQRRPTR